VATKKQQKRRLERSRAHARGERDEAPPREKPERSPRSGSHSAGGRTRRGRQPLAPSLGRAARRAALFAGLWFVVMELTALGGDQPTVLNAVWAASFFFFLWPVGYLTDRFVYNRLTRQTERREE
jgi:hypothetical protein